MGVSLVFVVFSLKIFFLLIWTRYDILRGLVVSVVVSVFVMLLD